MLRLWGTKIQTRKIIIVYYILICSSRGGEGEGKMFLKRRTYYKRRGRENILFGFIINVNYCLKGEANKGTCDFCAPASGKWSLLTVPPEITVVLHREELSWFLSPMFPVVCKLEWRVAARFRGRLARLVSPATFLPKSVHYFCFKK